MKETAFSAAKVTFMNPHYTFMNPHYTYLYETSLATNPKHIILLWASV